MYNDYIIKMESKYRYEITMSLILIVILTTILDSFNNVIRVVAGQAEDNGHFLDTSKNFIINLFSQVNNLSNSYQSTLDNQNYSQSIDNNLTVASETDEYIDSLERIIGEAKKYKLQEEYKPVFNNYMDSLQYEI